MSHLDQCWNPILCLDFYGTFWLESRFARTTEPRSDGYIAIMFHFAIFSSMSRGICWCAPHFFDLLGWASAALPDSEEYQRAAVPPLGTACACSYCGEPPV